jgi:copper chaperone NosL
MSRAEFFSAVSRARTPMLLLAALLVAAATVLPIWGMVLVSTQYPEGLRMVVYPAGIAGDLAEINALNHYIGMTPISDGFFVELQYLRPVLLGLGAVLVLAVAARNARWLTIVPLAVMTGLGIGGLGMMRYRLWQFGHQLDPQAPITIDPFTPPMIGLNQIAQFATYSYFSWGLFLPLAAAALLALVVVADRRRDVVGVRGALLAVA